MIKPTVGRVVWFHPSPHTAESGFAQNQGGPYAAIVAHVWGDRMVDLSVFDANGVCHSRTSVRLHQEGDFAGDKPPSGHYAEWMPYQVGQAARAEKLGLV